jgi:protein phosphatase
LTTSRFCRECGVALPRPQSAPTPPADAEQLTVQQNPPARPAVESSIRPPAADATTLEQGTSPPSAEVEFDNAQLQQQLIVDDDATSAATEAVEETTSPTQPLIAPDTLAAGDGLSPGTRIGEYQIVELHEERDGQQIYRAQAPADVCAQCGTRAVEPDAHFCEECGAELIPRDVLLLERGLDADQEPVGPARIAELPDEPLRMLLPPVTSFMANERQYLVMEAQVPGFQSLAELLATQGDAPGQPAALDEADALPIAVQLAQLLQFLHAHGTALGDLSLAQLLIGPQRRLRLRDASDVRQLTDATRDADLQQLLHTLEDLTRTPRETRKLSEESLEAAPEQPGSLQDVLELAREGKLPDAQSWVAALESVGAATRELRALTTRVGARTDVGVQRELDEDALMTQELRIALAGVYVNAGIYVVADGMGGHAAGEVASTLAVRAAANSVAQQLVELASASSGGIDDERLKTLVSTAVEQANVAVVEEGRRRSNDMGTTITLALVVGDRCIIGNVGDSRTYLLRAGQLQRISKDHSLVQRLVDVGQITEDDIYSHPHRNAILRSLGERPNVETDLFPLRLNPGDALFLCSDGLWEMVRNPRIAEVVTTIDDPQAASDLLVKEANANGGEDNITVVLVRFADAAAQADSSQQSAVSVEPSAGG